MSRSTAFARLLMLVLWLLVGGCAASPELQARWAAVRLVKDPEAVKHCDLLTIEHDDDFQHFREEAVRRGGNVVLVTGRKQYQFPCCMHDIAEIYRCP